MATEVMMPQAGYSRMRRWPRYKMNVPLRIVIQKPDKTAIVTGRGTELNEGGLSIFAGTELRVGQRVEIEFTPPYDGMPMRARATIRNRSGYNYGAEFLASTGDDKLTIEQIRQVLQAMGSPSD